MNYIHWNPPTDIINLGFFAIRWYGMLWGIGLIGATYIVARLFKEYKIADSKFASLFVYVFFGVLLGGTFGTLPVLRTYIFLRKSQTFR